MSRDQFNPNWPTPIHTTRENPLRDKVNLSRLDPEEKRKAFERLKEAEPGIAEFVEQMHGTFGKSDLYIDKQTADRLGVRGEKS